MKLTETYMFEKDFDKSQFARLLERNKGFIENYETNCYKCVHITFFTGDNKYPHKDVELIRAFAAYYNGTIFNGTTKETPK